MESTEDDGDRQHLVSIISAVHNDLRKAYKSEGNFQHIWTAHMQEIEVRREYAKAMLKLATTKWNTDSRIQWCYETSLSFFHNGGLQQSLQQEMKNLTRIFRKLDLPIPSDVHNFDLEVVSQFKDKKLRLLDVGSCYNPFSKFDEFEPVAIDLTPATEDVYQCDFSELEIVTNISTSVKSLILTNPLKKLAEKSFSIVVFSLLLSYFPSAEMRLKFCKKAWSLLEENGLLLIITPDSKNRNKNAPMIKSWKFALESIGFRCFTYEKKKHIHCLGFHKTCLKSILPKACVDVSKFMYIPQDFKEFEESLPVIERSQKENDEVQTAFFELPLG